ncbi:hypothetical protein L1049_022435 [Liquidambar formosana]|uniref:Protein kinase domain-containing protein n=1 Tax=Liquidambar formosana TaxID=63359 RepID=A0AAP0RCX7_LIQFO
MCNDGNGCLRQSGNPIDQQQHHQAVSKMDSPSTTVASAPGSGPSSNDETPRVKFLCSFSGSIMPRPLDGKLRYVGGETRIVSVPRDITYEELMGRMRELFEGAAVLKYQQPDEDLDALVSVVNHDDVTNMMEEYDKLGSGDGFTRLRIFLFSHPEQDVSSHYVDGDERDSERRYVDALNNLNDASDFRKQQLNESPVMSPADEIQVAEQFFNMGLEGGLHSQRNCEMPMPQFNLHHLTIPQLGSGQHQQPVTQRYSEMEAPWSPAYYSPRHPGHHDPRPLAEFPSSPSSARYRMPFGELPDKCFDRMPEEFGRQPVTQPPPYDHQPQFTENVMWLPTGAIPGEKAGFPGNILHGPNVLEGNSICEHCRMSFQRNQPQLEQANMGNGFQQVANPCAECPPNRETFMLNTDAKMHHGVYAKEQNDPRAIYNETHSHERGWVLHPQLNSRAEEPRSHISGAGRLNDHYIVDGTAMNFPLGHTNLTDGHHVSSNYVHHEDPRYIRAGHELGNEVFHDQAVAAGSHIHIPALEERPVRYGNLPYAYGTDNLYQVPHGHAAAHASWRNVQNPMHGAPSYEVSSSSHQANGTVSPVFLRGTLEGSPRFCLGDNQNPWVESSQKMVGFDGPGTPDYGQALKFNPNTAIPENHYPVAPGRREPMQLLNSSSTFVDDKQVSLTTSGYSPELRNDASVTDAVRVEEKSTLVGGKETTHVEKDQGSNTQSISCPEQKKNADSKHDVASPESVNSNCLKPAEECGDVEKVGETGICAPLEDTELSVNNLSFLPELIASVKRAALDGVEEVKHVAQEHAEAAPSHDSTAKEATSNDLELVNAHGDLELDSDNENLNSSRIEPTKAEEDAIDRGLQTIKNSDLEEIRELGSGTYGSVYHGKWKGSDVAVKRIKASCFAGKPSERERLIADFWKEALILSSLHHPNVVSFYGIVRDGPDGSLATVTEFMINGSLKQFLQKKDRTIDRRKRLIIAMDAAFGMEYLHGKNIVHFDLKCENLLVNMRDPHRPVCKIGDLGLSKVKQHTLVSGGVRGTLPWMAPELLSGKSNMVTEKIDIYSFGIVMWELLTGDEPYADMHCASIIGGIVNNTLRPQVPTWCDPEWKSLMESCWSCDPAERPSFSEISQRLRNMAAAMNVK